MTISDIKTSVTPLFSSYGIERAFLFGSYARGNANEQSDVDLRIDRGDMRGWQIGGLLLDLEETLHKNVDLMTTGSLSKEFLEKISKEEVLIYDRA